MKRIYWIAALLPLAAWCAAAQGTPDDTRGQLEQFISVSKAFSTEGMAVNGDITGAPYAADEITQFSQTLGDGTHIQRETKVAVYRDGQGRIRHEAPDGIVIADRVAGVSYDLNPKTMTGRKMRVLIMRRPTAATIEADGSMVKAKAKAEKEATQTKAEAMVGATYSMRGGGPVMFERVPAGEPIGQQMVEGLLCDGTRSVETIAAGAIGNDQPIQTINERWYSPELKTTIRTVRTDPRNGDQTFRVTNIRRGEPNPALFQVPAGYQIVGN